MEELRKEIQRISSQYSKHFKYIKQETDKISLAIGPYINNIMTNLKPFLDSIDREYNVDKEKYNSAITALYNKGFYLPILSTPRSYIEMNSYPNDQLEKKYLELFEDNNGNLANHIDLTLSAIEELVHPDWEQSIRQSVEIIRDKGVNKTYNLFVPLYFCYLEFIVRDKLPLKGTKEDNFYKLFKAIRESINNNANYSDSQKEFFTVLANSTFKNYYKYAKKEEFDIVSRNTLFHGYIGADKVTKLDFYKQISLLSHMVYFFNIYDSSNLDT